MFKEGIMYAAEFAYLLWVMFSLSLCAGMFVENPVQERFTQIRYYINVLGQLQIIYWFGNLLFDLGVFLIQAFLMIILVLPLKLEAYSEHFWIYCTLILAFGLAHLSFSYFISFWFSSPQSALKAYSLIYLIAGFFFPMILKLSIFNMFGCFWYHVAESIS